MPLLALTSPSLGAPFPRRPSSLLPPHRHHRRLLAIGPDGKFQRSSAPSPDDDDDGPPEAPEDSSHGISKLQQFHRQVYRARKAQKDQFDKDQHLFASALALEHDEADTAETPDLSATSGDDQFGDIDRAIAMKRKEFVQKGLLKPNPLKKKDAIPEEDTLTTEEVDDLDEISKLQGIKEADENQEDEDDQDDDVLDNEDGPTINGKPTDLPGFDLDFDSLGSSGTQILEPKFRMTLSELLDESRVVPISVYGDLEVEITGIQHDSRKVSAGDLFVCCVGLKTDVHLFLSEADKRGAVAVVATGDINIDETLGCKALVIVDDTNAVLPVLAASFYRNPSRSMCVIGVTGTNGKTTTSYLVKGIYEAMALRTGMLSTVGYFVHGDNQLEDPLTSPDAVMVQKLMAKMVHNGSEAMVMEASSHGLALGRCDEIDFDVAVFTNMTRDHQNFRGSNEEYRDSKAKLFAKMVDPERHRKIINIDDPSAPFFIGQGDVDVPVVTYAMENKDADVYPLKYDLSLFETQVLVITPKGILEISSGLLGRNNIYNILAAVAVGIAVEAPLEDIVRGIENVDAVPGRCELIDEEQAFAVIVDYAHTPDALSRLLDTVRELGGRRVITVVGCGGEQDRGKRPLMAKIATEKSDMVILTSDNPRKEDPLDILDDMLAGVGWTMQDYLKYGENDYYPPLPNGHRLFVHDIRRVAVRAAVAMGEEGDIVIIAGKGHESYQIEGEKKEFFDDREECREALHYVDELHLAGIDTSEFPWRLPESH